MHESESIPASCIRMDAISMEPVPTLHLQGTDTQIDLTALQEGSWDFGLVFDTLHVALATIVTAVNVTHKATEGGLSAEAQFEMAMKVQQQAESMKAMQDLTTELQARVQELEVKTGPDGDLMRAAAEHAAQVAAQAAAQASGGPVGPSPEIEARIKKIEEKLDEAHAFAVDSMENAAKAIEAADLKSAAAVADHDALDHSHDGLRQAIRTQLEEWTTEEMRKLREELRKVSAEAALAEAEAAKNALQGELSKLEEARREEFAKLEAAQEQAKADAEAMREDLKQEMASGIEAAQAAAQPSEEEKQRLEDEKAAERQQAAEERAALKASMEEERKQQQQIIDTAEKRIAALEGAIGTLKKSIETCLKHLTLDEFPKKTDDVWDKLEKKANRFEVSKLEAEAAEMGKTLEELIIRTRNLQSSFDNDDKSGEEFDMDTACFVGARCLSCNRAGNMPVKTSMDLFISDRQNIAIQRGQQAHKSESTPSKNTTRLPDLTGGVNHQKLQIWAHGTSPPKGPSVPLFLTPEEVEKRQALINAKQLSALASSMNPAANGYSGPERPPAVMDKSKGQKNLGQFSNWGAWKKGS